MKKVLVPIEAHDGARMEAAVAEAISMYREEPMELHLLNVQGAIPGYVAKFFKANELREIQVRIGNEELAAAQALLDAAGVPYSTHVIIGRSAETIVGVAGELNCDRIVMGGAGGDGIVGKLFGTMASQVRQRVGVAGNCKVIGY